MDNEQKHPADEVGSSEGLGLAANGSDAARAKAIDWAVRNHETTFAAVRWAWDAAVAAKHQRKPRVTTAAELKQQAKSDTSFVGAFARARP